MPKGISGNIKLPFPYLGLDVSRAYSDQPKGTSFSLRNVRGFCPATDRLRGAQRSGLSKYSPSAVSSSDLQLLDHVAADASQIPTAGGSAGTGFGSGWSLMPTSSPAGYTILDALGAVYLAVAPASGKPTDSSLDDEDNVVVDNPSGQNIQVQQFNNLGGINPNWNVNIAFALPAPIRTARGTNNSKGVHDTMTISSVVANTGDLMVVSIAATALVASPNVTWGAETLSLVLGPITSGNGFLFVYAKIITAGGTQTLTVQHILSTDRATAAVVSTVSQCTSGGAYDSNATATGSSNAPDSTAMTLSSGIQYLHGAVMTNGPSGDTAGSWTAPLAAGQRDGTTGGVANTNVTISEGYQVSPTAASSPHAAKTGITSRDWSAAITDFI